MLTPAPGQPPSAEFRSAITAIRALARLQGTALAVLVGKGHVAELEVEAVLAAAEAIAAAEGPPAEQAIALARHAFEATVAGLRTTIGGT